MHRGPRGERRAMLREEAPSGALHKVPHVMPTKGKYPHSTDDHKNSNIGRASGIF